MTVYTTTADCCMAIFHMFSVLGIYPGSCARQVCYISSTTFIVVLFHPYFLSNKVSLRSLGWLGTPYVA